MIVDLHCSNIPFKHANIPTKQDSLNDRKAFMCLCANISLNGRCLDVLRYYRISYVNTHCKPHIMFYINLSKYMIDLIL